MDRDWIYILADTVDKYIAFLLIKGGPSIIDGVLNGCKGHLREESKHRKSIIEKCLDILNSRGDIDMLFIVFKTKYVHRNSINVINRINQVLSNLIKYAQGLQLIYESHEQYIANVMEILSNSVISYGLNVSRNHNKQLLGIVEVLTRVKLSVEKESPPKWSTYRRYISMLKGVKLKQTHIS